MPSIGPRLQSNRTLAGIGGPISHRYWTHRSEIEWRKTMPYLLGWLLGVPVIVLVILYLIFH